MRVVALWTALAVHGIPHATGDLDVLVRPTAENAARVWRDFETFGAPVGAAGLEQADLTRPGTVYQMGVPPRRTDVMTELTGVSFEEAGASRVTATLEGLRLTCLKRGTLLASKRATGRPRDLADADALERGRGSPPAPLRRADARGAGGRARAARSCAPRAP